MARSIRAMVSAAWLIAVALTADAATLLDENFDSTSPGSVPGGWSVTAPAGTAVAVSNNLSYSSPNSLRFDKTTGTGGDYPQAVVSFSTASGKVLRVSYRARTSTSNHDSLYVKLRNAANQEVGGLRFSTAGTMQYQLPSGAWANTASNYAANVWYRFQIDFNLTNFTYTAWLDNSLLVLGAKFRTNTSTASSFLIQDRVVAGSGQSYLDDFRVEWVDPSIVNDITDQNFDSTADGSVPSSWTAIQTNTATNATAVGVSSDQSVSAPKSLKFETTIQDGASSAAGAVYTFPQTYSGGFVVVSFDARTSTTNHDSLYAKLRWGTGGNEIGGIRFNQTGVFAYQLTDGTWQATTNQYSSNTWYSITAAFDLDRAVFSAWANGLPIVYNAGFRSGSQKIGHSFIFQDRAFIGVGTSYVDNVRILRIAAPADVSAGIAPSTNYVKAGDPLVYTVYVTNHADTMAGAYEVSVLMPDTLNVVTSAPPGAQIGSGVVTWSLGSLAAGAVTTLTISATPGYSGSTNEISSVATALVSHAQGDWKEANNTSAAPSVTTVGIPVLGALGMVLLALVIAWQFWRQSRTAEPARASHSA